MVEEEKEEEVEEKSATTMSRGTESWADWNRHSESVPIRGRVR